MRTSHTNGRGGLMAWALFDWANSSFVTVVQTFVFAAYFTRAVAGNDAQGGSLWGLAIGVAGIVTALAGPVVGAIADQKGRRKPWLGGFMTLCVVATALLWFVPPSPSGILPALLLVAVGVVGTELAAVFYNAMLPSLAGEDRIGRWSGWGWALGYAGGLACLALCLFAFVREGAWFGLDREASLHVRATFPLVAGWYVLFSLPLFLVTPDEPSKSKPLRRAVGDGLSQIAGTIRNLRGYRHIVHFLIARMIYIDGLATLFAFGGVYAAGTFDMDAEQVMLFGIAMNVTAGAGAFAFAWIDDLIGSRRTILLSLAGMLLPGVVILFVQSVALFWVLGLVLGLFVGPVQAASRSYLARVAPPRLRNEMFGLYALSGKATAFAGPLAVGAITYATGSQRAGMATIFVLLCIGAVLMWRLPGESEAAITRNSRR